MRTILIQYSGLILLLLSFIGCDDFLSKNPNSGADEVLNKSSQVVALFNNSSLLRSSAELALASTDDYGLTIEIADELNMLDPSILNGLAWDIDGQIHQSYDQVWSEEYAKIFVANLVINEIDKITDLTEESRTEFLAQAHFIRALANWQLVTLYCQPYAPENLLSLGLPLKETTSYEEDQKRATLEETYAFIEADLIEALKTKREDVKSRWLVSKPAVHALLARFYLFKQEYAKAKVYAEEALKSSRVYLTDYNTLQFIERSLQTSNGEPVTVTYSELYGYSSLEYTDYCEFYYSQVYHTRGFMLPSDNLISIFDTENDLRFKHHFVKHGLLEQGLEGFGDDIQYHTFANDMSQSVLPAGPTIAEVMLIQAEAMARLGDYNEAMVVLNRLREKRFRKESFQSLSAASKEEAIRYILDERHREMPFVMYWQDVRRLAYNETTFDDIVLHRTFYEIQDNLPNYDVIKDYVLPVRSKRYAQPILEIEIARSGNQLKQNDYN